MSNEKKPQSLINKFSGLSRNKRILFVLSIFAVGFLITTVSAALITGTSIFGPPTTGPQSLSPTPTPTATPTPSPTPTPVYSGTIGAVTWTTSSNPSVHNPTSIKTGDTLTLTVSLTPAPLKTQDVWFYYSNTPIPVDNKGIPTNPDQLTGIDIATINPGATSASVTFHVTTDAQWYFIAEIPAPA